MNKLSSKHVFNVMNFFIKTSNQQSEAAVGNSFKEAVCELSLDECVLVPGGTVPVKRPRATATSPQFVEPLPSSFIDSQG